MMVELRVLWLIGLLIVTIGTGLLARAGFSVARWLRPVQTRLFDAHRLAGDSTGRARILKLHTAIRITGGEIQ
jgi:hypothetical protein